jgi:hypothetical protein
LEFAAIMSTRSTARGQLQTVMVASIDDPMTAARPVRTLAITDG